MAVGFCGNFLFVGLYLPYFPVWLEAQGLTPAEIGAVLSVSLVVRVLTSGQVTAYADRFADRAVLLTRLHVCAAASTFLYLFTDSFWPILIVTALYNVFFNPVLPLLDAVALAGGRRFGADYGRIRIWGSVVFILANLGGGWLLAEHAPRIILYALIASMVAGALASALVPRIGRRQRSAREQDTTVSWRSLMAERSFVLTLAAGGLGQASHALLYGFGTIHWRSLGLSGLVIGSLWAAGVVAEIILFRYSRLFLGRLAPSGMIALGIVGGLLRWSLFPVAGNEMAYFLLQLLHGLSFGAVHIGTMHYIMENVPEENLGTAQGIGFVLGGVSMGVGVFIAGPLYELAGAGGFFIMALACLLALGLLAAAGHEWKRRDG